MKRLKNIEGKNEQQLEAIKDQGERQLEEINSYVATSKSQKIEFDSEKNQKAKEEINRKNKNKKFVCFHSNGTPYNFNKLTGTKQLGNYICNGQISIEQANDEQDEMKEEMAKLENYNPINVQKINSKEEVFNNAKKLLDIRS